MTEQENSPNFGPFRQHDPRVEKAAKGARDLAYRSLGLGILSYQRYAQYRRRMGQPLPNRDALAERGRALGAALRRIDAHLEEPRNRMVAGAKEILPDPLKDRLDDLHSGADAIRKAVLDRLDPPASD